MNKKGFTLVEVLAVIVILGLIMTIVATKGFGAFDKTKEKIAGLNEEAIMEAAELLKVEIENCDDDFDSDLVKSLIGEADTNVNNIKHECDDLNKTLSGESGVSVSLDTLLEKGYVEGTGVEEINEEQVYTITYNRDSSTGKITYSKPNKETKFAQLIDGLLSEQLKYINKSDIESIKFVKGINDSSADYSWELNGSSDTNVPIKAWVIKNNVTGLYTFYIGAETTLYAPENSGLFLAYFNNVKEISFNNFNTSKVKVMTNMFNQCSSLTSLDLSSFDTSNVDEMDYMFQGCNALTSIKFGSFNTRLVNDMQGMFSGCSSLTNIDFSSFVTSNVTTMSKMFDGCSSLTSLDLRSFDTSNVTYMNEMFKGCSSLTKLDLTSFNISSSVSMKYMFSGCKNLNIYYNGDTSLVMTKCNNCTISKGQ